MLYPGLVCINYSLDDFPLPYSKFLLELFDLLGLILFAIACRTYSESQTDIPHLQKPKRQ